MTSRAQMGTAILLFNRRNLEDKDFRLRFGFMFDGYSITRKVYWWETVVLFRKLSVRLPRRARRHNSARAWLICTRSGARRLRFLLSSLPTRSNRCVGVTCQVINRQFMRAPGPIKIYM